MSYQNPVFIPGPTNIPEQLRKACDMPTIDHRSAAFADILQPALAGVKRVLKTELGEVVIFPGSGTGGWEAAISNTLSPGDKIIAGCNGTFSTRWIDMCQRHGLLVEVINVTWGDALPADKYEELLRADTGHEIKAVLATHNETATGVRSDIAAIRAALDAADHPALLLVDGVSSIGSMPFEFDAWGVDVAVAGSQKGFMLPAGLAIMGFSQKALAHTEKAGLHRTYFDIRDMLGSYAKNGYPYTPSVGLMNGLAESCKLIEAEGLENVFARHTRLAEGVRAAVHAWGMRVCANHPENYSDSVTAIRTPDGFDSGEIVRHAAETYGVAFGIGLGRVEGKVFRIGHLGMLTDVMVLSGIATAEMCMADLGLDITLGAGVAAAQEHYRHSTAPQLRSVA